MGNSFLDLSCEKMTLDGVRIEFQNGPIYSVIAKEKEVVVNGVSWFSTKDKIYDRGIDNGFAKGYRKGEKEGIAKGKHRGISEAIVDVDKLIYRLGFLGIIRLAFKFLTRRFSSISELL